MELSDEELIATRILNGSMSKKEIVKYVSELQKEIARLKTDYLIPDYILKEIDELRIKNNDYKYLLEGNLYKGYLYYKEIASQYQGSCISKQKIEDKINSIEEFKGSPMFLNDDCFTTSTNYAISILRELLEEE